ncbi:luciferase family protein [Cohnella caldifontis]|uniref:luciferase domain-containing protein n=1 Tax=Cohnella caldifontis TaxID=3027471 RepID=UPI0023EBD95A|nr:luciferase family protein [Cohnella sp. YIM B05605]
MENAGLKDELLSWPGVTALPHRFGGVEFVYEGKEIGHAHGERLVDVPLPKAERDRWIEAGKAEPHHIYPESGWVSIYLNTDADVNNAIEIMRAKYERMKQGGR